MAYNALGQLKQMTVGPSANGVATYLDYYGDGDPWGALKSFRLWRNRTVKSGNTQFELQYGDNDDGCDDVGNVKEIWNPVSGELLNCAYDPLDRLITTTGALSENYACDAIGNPRTMGVVTYTYPTSGPGVIRPHAFTARSAGPTPMTPTATPSAGLKW